MDEDTGKAPLYVSVRRYLEVVESRKKPNIHRKYKAVLNRFLDFFSDKTTPKSITPDDLNQFMVHLKKKHQLDNNSVIHNMIIVAQFLKKQGWGRLTRNIDLPEAVRTLPAEYSDQDLETFFGAAGPAERALFFTFLLTGFREQEVVNLCWDDVNFALNTVRVTAKPDLGFSPKRWEEREVPVPKRLIELLEAHPRKEHCRFVFPSPPGNRDYHMRDKCKVVAKRAGLDSTRFDLRKFRSTYATKMLRAGFDVRTVQHWLSHKSLETTMRYLSPAKDIHERLDKFHIAGLLRNI